MILGIIHIIVILYCDRLFMTIPWEIVYHVEEEVEFAEYLRPMKSKDKWKEEKRTNIQFCKCKS